MFGRTRDKTPPQPARVDLVKEVKEGGKGRATPRRSQAQAANRRPLVLSPAEEAARKQAAKSMTKDQKREARARSREQRQLTNQAMITGDERYLPIRDRGQVRRWVRDHVDARFNLGEYFLPAALVIVVLTLYPNPVVGLAATALLYVMVLAIAVDAFLLRRRLRLLTEEKFGAKNASGAATYGMLRSFQIRRMRLPRPQVGRREFPD